jgi:cytochrome c biogenesis protein CcmG/thiol:disulfide interchange protein DsbE
MEGSVASDLEGSADDTWAESHAALGTDTAGVRPRRRRRSQLWAAIGVGAAAIGLVVVLANAPPATNVAATSPLLGHAAPDVAGPSVLSGQPADLAGDRGRFMLVNFFATWCIPCRQEHSEFVAFMQRHQSAQDIGLIMVVFNDEPAKVRDWFAAHGGSWPAVADPGGVIALSYGITGVPETFLIDPHGVVVAKVVGAVTAVGLDRLLAKAGAVGA